MPSRLTPTMNALIDRRVLINYTVDADAVSRLLPAPFRPNLALGRAMVGICLIRLTGLRPPGFPRRLAMISENAAHRIAVEWDTPGGSATGVYVPRRDTDSRLAQAAGGRLFPGALHHASFDVQEEPGRYRIATRSDDGAMSLRVDAVDATELPSGSVFSSLAAASDFFRCDAVGYSPSRRRADFDALRLDVDAWKITPLTCSDVRSSYFEDRDVFPEGAVEFDCALSMHRTAARWSPEERIGAHLVAAY